MRVKNISLFTIAIFLVSVGLYAQEPDAKSVAKQEKKDKGVSYLQFELAHEEARMEGNALVANRFGINLDNYFAKNHFGLSGYAVTYKKYLNYTAETGHFLGGKAFREFNVPRAKIGLNFGAGFEWGNPSGLYDKTKYVEDQNGNILLYKHFFESRNSNIPYLKPHHDAVWHTLVEASVVKRGGVGIIQAGIRANLMSFGVDEYYLGSGNFVSVLSNRIVVVPSVFISFGLKI